VRGLFVCTFGQFPSDFGAGVLLSPEFMEAFIPRQRSRADLAQTPTRKEEWKMDQLRFSG
jgi:hypothetical protein